MRNLGRDRSSEGLRELIYIDSLDDDERASSLKKWSEKYLDRDFRQNFNLELQDLKKLSELFYKNINFLKEHRLKIKNQLDTNKKLKSFFN